MALRVFIFISELIRPTICVFIVGSFFISASGQSNPKIVFVDGKAIAVQFKFEKEIEDYKVVLEGSQMGIFGKWEAKDGWAFFTPVVAFSPDLSYQIFRKNTLLHAFQIPPPQSAEPLELTVFPSADTLPANLLKMYFQFSEPMKQLRSERFVFLLNEKGDTLQEVFQALHPELWNEAGDRLTLWIDPGRVKRDLIRNQNLGAPFESGKNYRLIVSNRWRSLSENSFEVDFEKTFFISSADRKKINPKQWLVEVPAAQSTDPLKIHFGESLDWVVAKENIWVINDSGEEITAMVSTLDREAALSIIPSDPWNAGLHKIQIDPKVADLAGNNLNRLFDEDLENRSEKSVRELEFVVR